MYNTLKFNFVNNIWRDRYFLNNLKLRPLNHSISIRRKVANYLKNISSIKTKILFFNSMSGIVLHWRSYVKFIFQPTNWAWPTKSTVEAPDWKPSRFWNSLKFFCLYSIKNFFGRIYNKYFKDFADSTIKAF